MEYILNVTTSEGYVVKVQAENLKEAKSLATTMIMDDQVQSIDCAINTMALR